MNWEQWFCPDRFCMDEAWMVRRDLVTHDIWWVAAHEDAPPFVIAATAPVCPHCGTTLLTQIELVGWLDRRHGIEEGPIFVPPPRKIASDGTRVAFPHCCRMGVWYYNGVR